MLTERDLLIYLYEDHLLNRHQLHQLINETKKFTFDDFMSPPAWLSRMIPCKQLNTIKEALRNQKRLHAFLTTARPYKTWTYLDDDYPPVFRTIPDPPVILYGKGDAMLIHHPSRLSVIGTREPSASAKSIVYYLLKPLINQDFILVSGLAKGIDSYVHRLASYYGGKTIAIIAGGFSHPYPKENLQLFHHLGEKHLIISEYPINEPIKKYMFPERNRLISGLSFATLIIEAKQKSGTMITADQALEQGRIVMAVPGSILDIHTEGCHTLLQSGAKLVRNTYDIIEEWDAEALNWAEIATKSSDF